MSGETMMEVAAKLRLTPKRKKRPKLRGAKPLLRALVHQQEYRCFYCDETMIYEKRHDDDKYRNPRRATRDHVIPLSRGGPNEAHNIVAACLGCNMAKGDMTAEEFKESLHDH